MNDYSCYLISNKPELFNQVTKNIINSKIEFFDGTGYTSFSQLVNACIKSSKTEINILMSDKVRPNDDNLQKTIKLINDGYAFVGLYRFGFFGFKKELFRKIGPLDERFIGGGYEDDDYYIRLKEANLSMYISHEMEYIKSKSAWSDDSNYIEGKTSWSNLKSKTFFQDKWGDLKRHGILRRKMATRKMSEISSKYNYGNDNPTDFLSWDATKIHVRKLKFLKSLIVK